MCFLAGKNAVAAVAVMIALRVNPKNADADIKSVQITYNGRLPDVQPPAFCACKANDDLIE